MRREDVVKLLDMMGARGVRARDEWVGASCPLAALTHSGGGDGTPSFNVSVHADGKSGFKCFGCGEHGDLEMLVLRWAPIARRDVGALLDFIKRCEDKAEIASSAVGFARDERRARMDKAMRVGDAGAPKEDPDLLDESLLDQFYRGVNSYITEERGIPVDVCREWNLRLDKGGPDPKPGHRDRIVFPVYRSDGGFVGAIGRATDDDDRQRYYNYWNFRKSKFLYGENKVVGHVPVAVVEGVIDAMVMNAHGIPTVAIFGAQVAPGQVAKLLGRSRIYLALDDDRAGQNGTRDAVAVLKRSVPTFLVRFPGGMTDPKQMSRDQALSAISDAERIF